MPSVFRVTSPLWHDGVAYAPGSTVAEGLLDPAQIVHLTHCGTLVLAPVDDGAAAGGADSASPPLVAPPASPSPAEEALREAAAAFDEPRDATAKKGGRK